MNSNLLTYLVLPQDQGRFLRDLLSGPLNLSRSLVIKLKQQHKIKVNGELARTSRQMQPGDLITVDLELAERSEIIPEELPLDIIYEDLDFLVVNKPAAMPTHPGNRRLVGTLANAVTYYYQQSGKNRLFRPVNRLDKDTSGLVMIAKSHFAHQGIFRQVKEHRIERCYFALVEGVLKKDCGLIDQPIMRPDAGCRKRAVHPEGRHAITHYQVLKRYSDYTYLLLKLETGRTHQIRVHLSYLGHPLCGDTLYGQPSPLLNRQALHAGYISFIHPRTKKQITLTAPLPEDLQKALETLEQSSLSP